MGFLKNGRIQGCCCCVDLKMGTYLMGALVVLSLLEELDYFNPIRLLVTVMTISFFFMMVSDDSERNRQYFFFLFCLWIVFRLIYYSIYGIQVIDNSIIVV